VDLQRPDELDFSRLTVGANCHHRWRTTELVYVCLLRRDFMFPFRERTLDRPPPSAFAAIEPLDNALCGAADVLYTRNITIHLTVLESVHLTKVSIEHSWQLPFVSSTIGISRYHDSPGSSVSCSGVNWCRFQSGAQRQTGCNSAAKLAVRNYCLTGASR
jgi:hypothetical protein